MPRIHCLTVGQGDCTLIEHGSGRISMIDICGGNSERMRAQETYGARLEKPRGNFGMCGSPTNPLDYINRNGFGDIWRFISTHPDMDHLDGFNNLIDAFTIRHFWDQGARKKKPDFTSSPYNEADWDRYVKARDGKESGTRVVKVQQGRQFEFANKGDASGCGDYITMCAPSEQLVRECNDSQNFNDASYILVYRARGGKIVLAGDADDAAWECAISEYPELLKDVGFLLAPHHGRDSGRNRSFLSHLKPRFSLLGCAPSSI